MNPDVSILIVSYNTCEMTLACLESVYEQTQGVGFEIIVIDNDSNDGSPDAIARAYPQTTLIRSGGNIGFAAANNLAARHAAGTFLLLLNPDTIILDGGIQKALAFAEKESGAAIIGGRTYFCDGLLNSNSCHGYPTLWSMLCMGLGLSALFRRSRIFDPESLGAWPRNSIREVDAVTGCFLLIKRVLWEQLNGFDEAFFMYGEDTDLCWRAKNLGHKSMITPDAQLIHYGGASEKVRADKMIRLFSAKSRLFSKHWSPMWSSFGTIMLDAGSFLRMMAYLVLSRVQTHRVSRYQTWREIWTRRKEYHITPAEQAFRERR